MLKFRCDSARNAITPVDKIDNSLTAPPRHRTVRESCLDRQGGTQLDSKAHSVQYAEMTDDRCLSVMAEIPPKLQQLGAESVFLVADPVAYERSGARAILEPLLASYRVAIFSDFEPNPKFNDVQAGLAQFRKTRSSVVIAIGGGTAIDIAKLIAACANESSDLESIINRKSPFAGKDIPLIAIPTTSGTGSEATQFAVVYIDGVKYSLDHPKLMPAYCVLDPQLSFNLPARMTVQTGLDALCQAIESLWSVRSSENSVRDATQAARLVLTHLPTAVHAPTHAARVAMCRASHLAGRAINQTRTTACHAVSYALTSDYGIPHGHAVALTLGAMLVHNAGVQDDDSNDPRGAPFVRQSISRILELLDCPTPAAARQRLEHFVESLGCETRLSQLGIHGTDAVWSLVRKVNTERLQNNPRQLTDDQLFSLLQSIA